MSTAREQVHQTARGLGPGAKTAGFKNTGPSALRVGWSVRLSAHAYNTKSAARVAAGHPQPPLDDNFWRVSAPYSLANHGYQLTNNYDLTWVITIGVANIHLSSRADVKPKKKPPPKGGAGIAIKSGKRGKVTKPKREKPVKKSKPIPRKEKLLRRVVPRKKIQKRKPKPKAEIQTRVKPILKTKRRKVKVVSGIKLGDKDISDRHVRWAEHIETEKKREPQKESEKEYQLNKLIENPYKFKKYTH